MMKIGDRVVATQNRGEVFLKGDTGVVVEVDSEDKKLPYKVHFDDGAKGNHRGILWWVAPDHIKPIEEKPSADALIAQLQAMIDALRRDYRQVGEASATRSAAGFTMVVFRAEDVPAGTRVYVEGSGVKR